MLTYGLRRLATFVPVMLLVTLAVAGFTRLLPGDVVLTMLGQAGSFTPEQLDRFRQILGLDRPFLVQYGDWLLQLLEGNLGNSLYSSRPVASILLQALPVTLEVVLLSLVLSLAIAVPAGIISATRQGTALDFAARVVCTVGISIPDFWLATILILVLSLGVGYLPPLVFVSPSQNLWGNIQQVIFPSAILAFRLSAVSSRMIRSALLEVLAHDYMRTARGKGLGERSVMVVHAFKNALIPCVTVFGSQLGTLLGGSIVVETVFLLPGVGSTMFQAVNQRDYTVVQGVALAMSLFMLVINLVIDLSYSWIDPRIRYR